MEGFFIKYGKEEHLKQIVDGQLRFAPARDYIEIEKAQNDKGQGDLLEGKWKIHTTGGKLTSISNPNISLNYNAPINYEISIDRVSELPILCLSYYSEEYKRTCSDKTIIDLPKEKIEVIKRDFGDATHALILLEPDQFIKDVKSIEGANIESSLIRYYDYEINDVRMLSYLMTGDEDYSKLKSGMNMTFENRYRHLFCKDKWFSDQNEFRFIVTNKLISKAVFFPFSYKGKYKLLPIEQLYKEVQI